ncbi:RNA-binding domain-containing protein [Aureobasidium namibiae CBS 147.97]|uniref:Multiple RNA-binding domain-containing protein 1 n=1 Tax=Aureobasidium namibiae CBS 147.97 TaxID=1043004 RepID=A0A074X1J7_9PEZI|nr:RNA-binding domain-containing protein [Aureobasidium namibiae CBS 147.97]KEQ68511.1 RNA-binding domain-containing protein [Aureobasidium namibiae CBS 147.97]
MESESSRIFVRGLPPTMSEADFKKHFGKYEVTDARLFPQRRIGYVGYKSPEDAQKAVKYFNRTFIRMSKIGVELARPIGEAPTRRQGQSSQHPLAMAKLTAHNANAEPVVANLKRKRATPEPETKEKDPKLSEFLNAMQAPSKLRGTRGEEVNIAAQELDTKVVVPEADSDSEYENVPKKPKSAAPAAAATTRPSHTVAASPSPEPVPQPESASKDEEFEGFEDEPAPPTDEVEEKVRASQRLYLRNLSYATQEDDLRAAFTGFGNLEEVHVPVDPKTGSTKGFAYLHFTNADSALQALRDMDGKVFQGRLLHILPAAAKREDKLDDFALSKLPLKKQQAIKRKREAASATFNWNSLYMNADAVMSSVADRLGVSKSELLDPTSSDAAVKQAHAETHVIQETKSYFKENGVDMDAFKKRERGDTAILVKNFPYETKASELKELFEQHGKIKRFLMPPSGTIAIVEFEHAPEARAAFASLAYRKIHTSVLFLEKAPKDLFQATAPMTDSTDRETTQAGLEAKASARELLQETGIEASAGTTSTLFVRNLNFSTNTDRLTDTFRPLSGFLTARVKTKTDPKKPGQVLSMGFGFLEFASKQQAAAAITAMDGYSLDGHKLQLRASHKATDAAEERRKEDKAKKLAARGTKIIIKNLPFEATKKDVRSLFAAYGQLRSVRVPKKFDKGARGFAFADFTTPKEAENAMDALRDTHLLGRRLVLDFAAEDPDDAEAEIEAMAKKAGSQLNKVALQKLTSGGRKKFRVGDDQDGLEEA